MTTIPIFINPKNIPNWIKLLMIGILSIPILVFIWWLLQ